MKIFIDPAYACYHHNRLFQENDPVLNRDGTLLPYIRLKKYLEEKQYQVNTADFLLNTMNDEPCEYYSFGMLENLDVLSKRKNVHFKAFSIAEPPVVAPHLYQEIPRLCSMFDHIYVHNTVGDGYSLKGVATYKLKKWYYPQPYDTVQLPLWGKADRQHRVVVINGNHKPRNPDQELYSHRIKVMNQLAKAEMVDLYGRNWEKWYSRESWWMPYIKHRKMLLSIYRGTCQSKLDILSEYHFCLCFENMQMLGYITEKIFDCLYAGTIPIYWGAKDIQDWIPSEVYIDFREFKHVSDLITRLQSMSTAEILAYKEAGKNFLNSEKGRYYYNFLTHIMDVSR